MNVPRFSVVVPTYNRPGPLTGCLAALGALDYPRERFEVVVVDDGSDLDLRPVVAPHEESLDVRLIRQSNGGPASARNRGAAEAAGDLLAFTDDDCAPAPGWLRGLAAGLARAPEALIAGRTVNALAENPFSEASQLLIDFLYAQRDGTGAMEFAASNNIALAADAFHTLGGFAEHYPLAAGEDRDFCDRWLAAGRVIVSAPEAVIYHRHRLSLRSFWRQHANYGRGAYHVHRDRAARDDGGGFGALRFYADLVRYPLMRYQGTRYQGTRGLLLAGLMALSQAATVAGYAAEASGR